MIFILTVVWQTTKNTAMHMGSNSLQVLLLMGVGLRTKESWEEKIQYLIPVWHMDDIEMPSRL